MSHIIAPHGVLNTYGELAEIKSRLGIAGNGSDPALWMALHAASRDVDAFCNRRFYVEHATRCFDVASPEGFVVPDLVSVSSMMEDADRDRVYEIERTRADYILYPLNAEPDSHSGRPYNLVRADPAGPRPAFTTGRIAVRIEGTWGYRAHAANLNSPIDFNGAITVSSDIIPVTDRYPVAAGQTLLIKSEQVFVRAADGHNLTVVRGVNGTAAVAHQDGTAVLAYRYPPEVVEATLVLAAQLWKRKDVPYGTGGPGASRQANGRDPGVEAMLSPLRRLPVGGVVL